MRYVETVEIPSSTSSACSAVKEAIGFVLHEPPSSRRTQRLGLFFHTGQHDCLAYISADGLELYFTSLNRPGGYGGWDAWVTRRPTKDDAWGEPMNLGPIVNSSASESITFLSFDDLLLFFSESSMPWTCAL
jgi:hypothetical protein